MMTVQDKLRALHTQRWSIVNCTRQQTVAEHSWGVTVIADEIARLADLSHQRKQEIRRYAVYHDVAEAIVGDIPTPTKRRLGTIIQELEEQIYTFANPVAPQVKLIVKMADRIEAINFLEVNGVGRHARKILKRLKSEFDTAFNHLDPGAVKTAIEVTYRNAMHGENEL